MSQVVPDVRAFILKARLFSDSLQNGIVNKSPSDECRLSFGSVLIKQRSI